MSSKTTPCSEFQPYSLAERTPDQGRGGCGARHRSAPTGGAANGMPLKPRTPSAFSGGIARWPLSMEMDWWGMEAFPRAESGTIARASCIGQAGPSPACGRTERDPPKEMVFIIRNSRGGGYPLPVLTGRGKGVGRAPLPQTFQALLRPPGKRGGESERAVRSSVVDDRKAASSNPRRRSRAAWGC